MPQLFPRPLADATSSNARPRSNLTLDDATAARLLTARLASEGGPDIDASRVRLLREVGVPVRTEISRSGRAIRLQLGRFPSIVHAVDDFLRRVRLLGHVSDI